MAHVAILTAWLTDGTLCPFWYLNLFRDIKGVNYLRSSKYYSISINFLRHKINDSTISEITELFDKNKVSGDFNLKKIIDPKSNRSIFRNRDFVLGRLEAYKISL